MFQDAKEQAVEAIRHSYRVLSTEQNLSPDNDRVSYALTGLRQALKGCQSPELVKFLLATPELSVERENLPDLCGRVTCEMEKFWAKKLIVEKKSSLEQFCYYPDYCELCRDEMSLVGAKKFKHISFLGSGSLPMTALLVARHQPEAAITCVDHDPEAVGLSKELIRKMGLEKRIAVREMNAMEYVPERKELVICASMLRGYARIYARLREYGCALIVRNAEGQYLYIHRTAQLPESGFNIVAKTEISARRVNTSLYYESDAGAVALAA